METKPEEKPNPIKVALEARKKAEAELKLKRMELAQNVGKAFSNGEIECTVTEFQPDKNLKGVTADSYLVNFGNPHAFKSVHCDEFLKQYKGKE